MTLLEKLIFRCVSQKLLPSKILFTYNTYIENNTRLIITTGVPMNTNYLYLNEPLYYLS